MSLNGVLSGSIENDKKRTKSTYKLEEEILGGNAHNRQRRDNMNENEAKFFGSLKDVETLLGPQLCGICDRDISKSIKVRCLECNVTPALSTCLECLRTGRERDEAPY